MAIKNLVSSSTHYNYGSEGYNSDYLNWSLEEEAENKASADMAVIDAESEIDSAEHAANAADAMSGVLEVAESNGGEVTENEASLIDDVNTAVSGSSTSDDPPVSISSESNGRYYISTEAILDKIKEIWERVDGAIGNVWDKVKDTFKKYFGVFSALRKRAEDLVARLRKVKSNVKNEDNIEYSSNVAYLHLGSSKITNVGGLMNGFKRVEDIISDEFISNLITYGDSLTEFLVDYDKKIDVTKNDVKVGEVDFITSRLEQVSKDFAKLSPVLNSRSGTPFVGGTMISLADSHINEKSVQGEAGWVHKLNLHTAKSIEIGNAQEKFPKSVSFSVMSPDDVETLCNKIIEICNIGESITSSSGLDKLISRRNKIKSISIKLDKTFRKALSTPDEESSLTSTKYNSLIRVNKQYASLVTRFTRLISLTTGFITVSLNLSTKSCKLHNIK